MPDIDLLNNNSALPNMNDFYFDAVDHKLYKEIADAIQVNNRKGRTSPEEKAHFCTEEPPAPGYDDVFKTYCIIVNTKNKKEDNHKEYVGDIEVADGDTITLTTRILKDNEDENVKKYIENICSAQLNSFTANNLDENYLASNKDKIASADQFGIIGLRFACIDTKELPHFINIGSASFYNKYETTKKTYEELESASGDNYTHYVRSKWKSYIEAGGKDKNIYNQSNKKETLNFMKIGSHHYQYFDKDGLRYLLNSDDTSFNEKEIIDAGLARDLVYEKIQEAEDMRILIDASSINRMNQEAGFYSPLVSANEESWWTSWLGYSHYMRIFYQEIGRGRAPLQNAGWAIPGLDVYNRALSVVYVKINGVWINLNKFVLANTNFTQVEATMHSNINMSRNNYYTRAFHSESYHIDDKIYADSLWRIGNKFDDRESIHKRVFDSISRSERNSINKNWTLIIGDTVLIVPPQSIQCLTQTQTERFPVLRAKGTMVKGSSKVNKLLQIELYFNEDHGINGVKLDCELPKKDEKGKKIKKEYHLDGLRSLIAQFKLTPFLPIENNYINMTFNIDAVALHALTVSTVPGFPRLLKASLQLSAFEYRIYMPEIPFDTEETFDKEKGIFMMRNFFSNQINWELFRYYYQRLINNGEKIKDLPFLSEDYIKSTFGNKTCLVPMKFNSSEVKFYIPNREQLTMMKQIKLSRLTKPTTAPDLTLSQKNLVKDLGILYDTIESSIWTDKNSVLNQVNKELKAKENTVLNLTGENYNVFLNSNEKSEIDRQLNRVSDDLIAKIKNIKGNAGGNIITSISKSDPQVIEGKSSLLLWDSGLKWNDVSNNPSSRYYSQIVTAEINLELIPKKQVEELIAYTTGATGGTRIPYTEDEIYKKDEIFKTGEILTLADKKLKIEIPISLKFNYKEQNNKKTCEVALGKNFSGLEISGDSKSLYVLSIIKGYDNNNQSVKGNEEANKLNNSIDWEDIYTVKWEPYELAEPLIAESLQFSMTNNFAKISLQSTNGFAPQYMGGSDVQIGINFKTQNAEVVAQLDRLVDMAAEYVREYAIVLSNWPVKIETDISKFLGVTDVLLENVQSNTVPGYPGLYDVTLTMVSVDRTLRNKEALFKKDLDNFQEITVNGRNVIRAQTLDKIDDILSEAELYPDLELPTLQELRDNGWEFMRYSNKNRTYPDPDFYYTYAHVLYSQLIRESVLRAITNKSYSLYFHDDQGNTGAIMPQQDTSIWFFNPDEISDPNTTADKSDINDINDLSQHLYEKDPDYGRTWDISKNIKVALCENFMVNSLYKEHEYIKKAMKEMKKNDNTSFDSLTEKEQDLCLRLANQYKINNISLSDESKNSEKQESEADKKEREKEPFYDMLPNAYTETITTFKPEIFNTEKKDKDKQDNKEQTDTSKDEDKKESSKTQDKKAEAEKKAKELKEAEAKKEKEAVDNALKLYQTNNKEFESKHKVVAKNDKSKKGSNSFVITEWQKRVSKAINSIDGILSKPINIEKKNFTEYFINLDEEMQEAANHRPRTTVSQDIYTLKNIFDTTPLDILSGYDKTGKSNELSELTNIYKIISAAASTLNDNKLYENSKEDSSAIDNFNLYKTKTIDKNGNAHYADKDDNKFIDIVNKNEVYESLSRNEKETLALSKYAKSVSVESSLVEFGLFKFKKYSNEELSKYFPGDKIETCKNRKEITTKYNEIIKNLTGSLNEDKIRYMTTNLEEEAFHELLKTEKISIDNGKSYLTDKDFNVFKSFISKTYKLLDPYYRNNQSLEKEYIYNCLMNIEYAYAAYWRICLINLKRLLNNYILPSFAFDICSDTTSNLENVKNILDKVVEKKLKKQNQDIENKIKILEEQKKQISNNKEAKKDNTKKESTATKDNKNKDTDTQDKQASIVTVEEQIALLNKEIEKQKSIIDEAKKNAESNISKFANSIVNNRSKVHLGKIFMMTAATLENCNREFLEPFVKRDYKKLNSLISAAKLDIVDEDQYSKSGYIFIKFVRSLIKHGIISGKEIGNSKNKNIDKSTIQKTLDRTNQMAAADDPSKWLYHSYYDMIVNDARGRMARAFPTFYMTLIDEGRQIGFYKLHDDFYNTSSIAEITITKSRKIAADTAEITMSNIYKTFTTDDADLNYNYTYRWNDLIDDILRSNKEIAITEEQRKKAALPAEKMHIRPGARINIKMGYTADAARLPTMFNGYIAEVDAGDIIHIVAQGDGIELTKPIVQNLESYQLPGYDKSYAGDIGRSGATPKETLSHFLTSCGGRWNAYALEMNIDPNAGPLDKLGWEYLKRGYYNIRLATNPPNPYGIFHFGDPRYEFIKDEKEPLQNIFEIGLSSYGDNDAKHDKSSYRKNANIDTRDFDRNDDDEADYWSDTLIGTIAGGVALAAIAATGVGIPLALAGGAAIGLTTAFGIDYVNNNDSARDSISTSFIGNTLFSDNVLDYPQLNINFFGKSVWDIMHIVKGLDSSYIASIVPFGYRSTVFFGRPHDYYAYNYGRYEDGSLKELRKPFQQYHLIHSATDIIGNNFTASAKNINTVAVGIYNKQGSFNSVNNEVTEPIYIDWNIYPEFQKTMHFDTQMYGRSSRKLGLVSDGLNFFFSGLTQNNIIDLWVDDTGDVRSHHNIATRLTRNALKESSWEMYTGNVVILGNPVIKPYDLIGMNDTYKNMDGVFQVRDVVTTMSIDAGFVTTITPDLYSCTIHDAQSQLIARGSIKTVSDILDMAMQNRKIDAEWQYWIRTLKLCVIGGLSYFYTNRNINKAKWDELAKILDDISDLKYKSGTELKNEELKKRIFDFFKKYDEVFDKDSLRVKYLNGSWTNRIFSSLDDFAKSAAGSGRIIQSLKNFPIKALVGGAKLTTFLLRHGLSIATFGMSLALEVAIGAGINFLGVKYENRKSLIMFPINRYGIALTAGIGGHQGVVYGSATFGDKDMWGDLVEDIFGGTTPAERSGLQGFLYYFFAPENLKSRMEAEKAIMLERKNYTNSLTVETMNTAMRSNAELYSRFKVNLNVNRYDGRKKHDIDVIRNNIGIINKNKKAFTEKDICSNTNWKNMVYVPSDDRLKKFINGTVIKNSDGKNKKEVNTKFLRIPSIDDTDYKKNRKVKELKLDTPQGGSNKISVYAYTETDLQNNIIYNIPFLSSDAIGILSHIVEETFNDAIGKEESTTEDWNEYIKKHGDTYLVLSSALKAGSLQGLESTGYTFVLQAHSGKDNDITKSLENSIIKVQENFKKLKESGGVDTPNEFEYKKIDKNKFSFKVNPPLEGTS